MKDRRKIKQTSTHQERSAPASSQGQKHLKANTRDYKGRAIRSLSCVRCLFWYLLACSACEHQFHTIPVHRSWFQFISFSNRWLANVKNHEQPMIPQHVRGMYSKIQHGARTNAGLWCFKVETSLSASWAVVKNGKCSAEFFTFFENEDSQSRRSPYKTLPGPFACLIELPPNTALPAQKKELTGAQSRSPTSTSVTSPHMAEPATAPVPRQLITSLGQSRKPD